MVSSTQDSHDHGPPGADLGAIQQGHENDRFGIRPILRVPLLVVLALIFTYVLVTTLIGFAYNPDRVTQDNNVQLANRNREPTNQRFSQISSTDVNARIKQPRLEYLKEMQQDSENRLTEPAYVRSKVPTTLGNSPEYRPESLLPENFVDPMTGRKILMEYRVIGNPADHRAQIPISVAMNLAVEKRLLPIRPNPVIVPETSWERPKFSNAGRGGVAAPPEALTAAAKPLVPEKPEAVPTPTTKGGTPTQEQNPGSNSPSTPKPPMNKGDSPGSVPPNNQ